MNQVQRKSPRIPEYDYGAEGACFVSVCTAGRKAILGIVAGETVKLFRDGKMVWDIWMALPEHYENIELDEFVVMPNHVHGIVRIKNGHVENSTNVGEGFKPFPTKKHGLSEIMRGFKTFSARRINEMNHTKGQSFWQRSFYDHVIRNDDDLYNHRKYIQENSLKWVLDEYYG